ncbi:MAG: helix-turn-helix transcriptional regulator [Ruminococcaceae bacterium]|nr:helix-turn-helix transcriptional regulator [Oscillospiraceae bacterium]
MPDERSPLCKAVKNRILQLCAENDLTINALATISGLPPSSIKNIFYGKSKNPKIATIKIICDGLNMSLKDFFDSDEFDRLEQEIR